MLELEIQGDREVGIWNSMYELIKDSYAASIYLQSFIDRNKKEIRMSEELMEPGAERMDH